MKLPYRGILCTLGLLAAVFLLPQSRPFAQSSYPGGYPASYYATPSYSYGATPAPAGTPAPGYASSGTYLQSGPVGTLLYGNLNFKVPVSLTGHAFALKYWNGSSTVTSSATVMGVITASTGAGGAPSALYLAVAGVQPTGTQFNVATTDWWLADTTAQLEPAVAPRTFDLVNASWRTVSGASTRYFAIPDTRAGHALFVGLPQTGANAAWSPVSSGAVIWTSYAGAAVSLHYFVGSAPATGDPGLDGYLFVADRNTDQKTPWGKTDVRAPGDWVFDPGYSFYPTVHVRVTLEARETGHSFTVHSRIAGAPEMPVHCVAQPGAAGTNTAVLDIQVGSGLQFWITRDAENGRQPQARAPAAGTWAAGTNTSQTLTFPAVGCFPAPPARGQWVRHRFRVNAGTRAHHTLSVRMDDGYTTFFNETEHSDPATDTLVPAYGLETIAQWGNVVLFNPLPIITFTAMIDRSRAITLRDDSIASGGGLAQDITVDPDVDPTDVFDGWVPMQPQTPDPTITIHVPSGRGGHGIALFAQANQPAIHPWPNPEPHYVWPSPLPALEAVTVPGVDGMGSYELKYYSLTLSNPTPYHGGPFTLQDVATLDPHDVAAGENDLRDWFLREHPVDVQISTSRMDHHLRVRHPNGEFFEITHPVAADTSTLGPYRVVSSAPYYYFDATSSARAEMPWYVEDLDTGERTGPGPGQSHPDNDALIMWIAVAPPTGLTAHSGIHGIDLAWVPGQAATGGGFIIERRESMKTEGPFTPWHELARVGDGLPSWRDTRIAPGEYVIYRVRAFFGSGPNERHSAPSNRARAAMWIDRGGGIYGTPGDDDGTGPNSVVDPPGGDGGSGAGIPGDGDGDGDPDNDDDGVVDINDRYPNDPLRSDDVAVAFYGAIDLKKYPFAPYDPINPGWTSPIYGGSGPLMTISDENTAAWAGVVQTTDLDPDNEKISALRIVGWADGALMCNVKLPLTWWGAMTLFPNTPPVPTIIRYALSPVGISAGDSTASPVVAGNVTASVWFLIPGSLHYSSAYISLVGTFEATSSGISWNVGTLSEPHIDLRSYSRLGHRYGIRRWKIHDSLGDHYHQRVTIDGVDLPFGDGPSESAYSLAISDLGYTVASIRHDDATQSFDGYYLCAPGASASRLPLTEAMVPMGVNDQRWVVGSRGEHDAVRGDLGFVLVGGVSLRTFHDLLPTEYQKQLRSAIPAMISNATQPGGKPRILFTAESYEGDPGAWVPRSLILHWDATGNPVVDRVMLPAAVVDPATHTVQELGASFAAWNKQQDFAALVGAPGEVPFPAILRPCPFQANRPYSEGFDPPMVGDVDPKTNERDEEDWVPWTSVAKSGPLSLNTRTKLLFPPGSPYWQHDVIAADDAGVPYSTPLLALATVDEDAPFAEETPLTIHGTPGGSDVRKATILVRMNDSTQQVVWKMKVMVLRASAPIELEFYNLPDTNPAIETPAGIAAEINDRFVPAAVVVHPAHPNWESDLGIAHGGDWRFVLKFYVLDDDGINAVRGITKKAFGLTQLNYHYFALYTDAREGDEGVTDTMARTAAHEFGHFLTLSTRAKNYSAVPTGHDDELGVYDTNLKSYGTGKYPPIKPSKTVQALMRSGDQIKGTPRPPGRWIRHEDWEAANIEAWKVKP